MASKVVILTGASRGIGLASAHWLLKNGHKVLAVARSEDALRQLKGQYPDGQCETLTADLGDLSTADRAIKLALSKFSRIDSLVLNHGVLGQVGRLEDANTSEWATAFNINFLSLVVFIKAAIPSLRETNGRVIFTSSGAAQGAYPAWGCYGASKAALNHLNMTLGTEEQNITSISVRPGVVDTNMQKDIREVHADAMGEGSEKFKKLHFSGQLLKPEQPGHVIAKLAVGAGKELSGKFLSWNDEVLKAFQE